MKVKIKSLLQVRKREKYLPFILTIITASIPIVLAYFLWNPDTSFTIANFLSFLATLPTWVKNNTSDALHISIIIFVVLFIGIKFSINNIKKINQQLKDKEIMCVYLNDNNISLVGKIGNHNAIKNYLYSEIDRIDMLIKTDYIGLRNGRYVEAIDSIDILFKFSDGIKIRFSPFNNMVNVWRFIDISNKVKDFDYQVSCKSSFNEDIKYPIIDQIEYYKKNGRVKTEIWYCLDFIKVVALFGIVYLILTSILRLFLHL